MVLQDFLEDEQADGGGGEEAEGVAEGGGEGREAEPESEEIKRGVYCSMFIFIGKNLKMLKRTGKVKVQRVGENKEKYISRGCKEKLSIEEKNKVFQWNNLHPRTETFLN